MLDFASAPATAAAGALEWTLLLLGVLGARGPETLESWIVPVLPAFTVAR